MDEYNIQLNNVDQNEYSNDSYFCLVKIRYGNNIYKMVGKQFLIPVNKPIGEIASDIFNTTSLRILVSMEQYNFEIKDLIYVQFILKNIKKSLLTDLRLDDNFYFQNKPLSLKKDIIHAPFFLQWFRFIDECL